MMKLFKTLMLLFAALFFVSSCGGGDDDGKKVIAITVMDLGNPFFVELTDAAKAEGEKNGYKVIIFDGDAEEQSKQIKDFINDKVAAIIITPKDAEAIAEPIKLANAAGIPVFTADTGCSDPTAKVVSNVESDNYGGGLLAGQAMIEALGGTLKDDGTVDGSTCKGGKVLVLDYKVAQSCIKRVKGFKEVIAAYNEKYPDTKIVIVAELPSEAKPGPSKKVTEDQLNSNPDLVGIFAINDPAALGAVVAVEKAGKKDQVKIIGFDGQREGKLAIKAGQIYADPIQFPKQIGKMTIQKIIDYKNGKKVDAVTIIPTALYRKADADKDPELEKK